MNRFTDDEFAAMLASRDRALQKWCRMNVADPEEADDLWQEVKATAWEKRAEFRGESDLLTWMVGTAKYKLLNQRRKRGELLTEDGLLDDHEPGLEVLKGLRQEERENFVLECISTLDKLERDVAWRRYAEDLPLAVIDRELGLTGSGSRNVLQNLKRRLGPIMRARLAEMGHGSSFVRTTW